MPAGPNALLSLMVATVHLSAAAEQTADAIMALVARNQDQAEEGRRNYIYRQHARVTSRKGSRLMCEEITDSRVTPSASGSDQQMLKLAGKVFQKGKYVTYTALQAPRNTDQHVVETAPSTLSVEIGNDDRDMVQTLRSNLFNDKSKDGIAARLFPLTSKHQSDYSFTLVGREHVNGRDAFHIRFSPKDNQDFGWKGDAYIDATAYQPVLVTTAMARKVPLAVRTLLGTNLPGLGFSVTYAPVATGVWFPVSFGTEFKISVLFFYKRDIVVNADNRDFERTVVDSKMVAGADPEKPQ